VRGTLVTRTFNWAMGHRLQHHEGLCRFPHGHSYSAEVTLTGAVDNAPGPSSGMVIDFSALDEAIAGAVGHWDHAFMLQDSDPLVRHLRAFSDEQDAQRQPRPRLILTPWAPTAENIALEIAQRVSDRLAARGLLVVASVRVHEGPKSVAEWRAL
jgi:6-pyruvoyltetrahydropterin/6-carboxytetrahydropterin synthase